MFVIQWWLIAIAMGGLFQAAKSLQYGADPTRPRSIRQYWAKGGLKTLGNMSVVVAAGLYFALWFPYSRFAASTVLAIYYVLSIVLTYGALYLWNQHVSASAAAKYRGLLSRTVQSVPAIGNRR